MTAQTTIPGGSTVPKPHILVVDDDPAIRFLLYRVLLDEGYSVSTAPGGMEALDALAQRVPDLILLDINMPGMNGYELCRLLKKSQYLRLVPIVMITAQGELQRRLDAWEDGADDFLAKPFHISEVTVRCRSLLRIKRLIEERDSAEDVVFALARAIEAKSPYTMGHSERVTHNALALGHVLKLSGDELRLLKKGGLLHDIGKLAIPDAILNKPGPLTPEEMAIVREHPLTGVRIVGHLASLRDATNLIRSHHERLDGRGYPDGLSGDGISQLVRIMTVADVYDSLASDRPYRSRIPHDKCLGIMRENAAGGGLDPALVALLPGLELARPGNSNV
jgi:putative two-component system response regulator